MATTFLKQEDVKKLMKKYNMSSFSAMAAGDVLAINPPPRHIVIYKHTLSEGLVFPLTSFISSTLALLGVYPGQLLQNSVRILVGFEMLCFYHDIPCNPHHFNQLFRLSGKISEVCCLFYFTPKPKSPRIYRDLRKRINHWCQSFFFMEYDINIPKKPFNHENSKKYQLDKKHPDVHARLQDSRVMNLSEEWDNGFVRDYLKLAQESVFTGHAWPSETDRLRALNDWKRAFEQRSISRKEYENITAKLVDKANVVGESVGQSDALEEFSDSSAEGEEEFSESSAEGEEEFSESPTEGEEEFPESPIEGEEEFPESPIEGRAEFTKDANFMRSRTRRISEAALSESSTKGEIKFTEDVNFVCPRKRRISKAALEEAAEEPALARAKFRSCSNISDHDVEGHNVELDGVLGQMRSGGVAGNPITPLDRNCFSENLPAVGEGPMTSLAVDIGKITSRFLSSAMGYEEKLAQLKKALDAKIAECEAWEEKFRFLPSAMKHDEKLAQLKEALDAKTAECQAWEDMFNMSQKEHELTLSKQEEEFNQKLKKCLKENVIALSKQKEYEKLLESQKSDIKLLKEQKEEVDTTLDKVKESFLNGLSDLEKARSLQRK